MHIHVSAQGAEAKIWLEPQIQLAQNHGFNIKQLNRIEKLVRKHYETISTAWNEYHRSRSD